MRRSSRLQCRFLASGFFPIPFVGPYRRFFKYTIHKLILTQLLKPLEVGILTVIMLIGIIALATELTEYEEVAKVVVIPSLVLLIIVTGYAMLRTAYLRR